MMMIIIVKNISHSTSCWRCS